MAWTYLLPRNSTIASSPVPTTTVFKVQAGAGAKFIPGPATENGFECNIDSISGDTITLSAPLTYAPAAGEELVQLVINQKDKVRLLVGDTDSTDPFLQDEEIAIYLSMRPNPLRAAVMAAQAIAALLSRKADYQIYQEIQERMGQTSKAYLTLAERLRLEASRGSAVPFQGGLLNSAKDIAILDTTKVQPFFTRDMMEEPGTQTSPDLSSIGFVQPYY